MPLNCTSIDNPESWNKIIDQHPHCWFHTHGAVYDFSQFYKKEALLYSQKTKDYSLIAPLFINKGTESIDLLSPYGYSGIVIKGNITLAIKDLIDQVKSDKYTSAYIKIHPFLCDEQVYTSSYFYHRNSSYFMDLNESEEKLFSNLKGRKRSQVKIKGDCLLTDDQEKLCNPFIELYKKSMLRLGADSLYCFDTETLNRLIEQKETYLIGVEEQGEISAVTMSGSSSNCADFLLSGASEEGRRHSSALLWASAVYYKSQGMTSYHLGGGMNEGDGLDKFKALFGGQKCDYGALKVVGVQSDYERLCLNANKDPDDLSGFFPSYRAPES